MFPVMFELGPLTIYTYGLLAAAGFVLGVAWSLREGRGAGLTRSAVLDLSFYFVLAAIVGARLLFVFINWGYFRDNLFEAVMLWRGGLVFYGGLIAVILFYLVYVPRKKLPFWLTADVFAPGIALGQAVGRLGCLAAGCCYGRPADLPWAVTFTDPRGLAPLNQPLHPTQIYTFLSLLVIFFLLVLLRRRRSFYGQIFWSYCLLHGLIRFGLEFFRGDFRGLGPLGLLTVTQVAALTLVAVSAIMMAYLYRSSRPGRAGSAAGPANENALPEGTDSAGGGSEREG